MNAPYRFGRFELDPATRQLLADGQPFALGARAFDVLLALIERRERLVPKDELLELVWPGLVVEENNLQVQISTLRKLLGSQAIATIPGRGYRFSCGLEGDAALSSDKAVPLDDREVRSVFHSLPWLVPGLAAALVVVAVAGGWLWSRRDAPADRVAAKAEIPLADSRSIAVLPFTNMSDDKDAAYFADGVQQDLLTQLALLGELKVISRTSVAEYRSSTKNARQIGTELGVASLVEGSVRRTGNRVRVAAQLIDARTDKQLWGNSYDRELKDIFAIQSEIATAIARVLKVTLSPLEQTRLARKPTENLVAYELFLRHQELRARAMAVSADVALEERIALLTRAVELDPKFALAWARLASEHAFMYFSMIDPNAARVAHAKQAIDRALALAPDDIDVRSEAGNFHHYGQRDFARAAQYFDDLLRIAPNHVETLLRLSSVRRRQGRWLDANALLEQMLGIDARNLSALQNLQDNFLHFRHFDEAWSLQRKITDLRPGDLDARCHLHEIEWLKTGSFAAYDAWRAVLPPGAERASALVWQLDMTRAVARRDFDALLRLLDTPPAPGVTNSQFVNEIRAFALLAKGERAQALELARSSLRKAAAEWQRKPNNLIFAKRTLMNRALLGERKRLLAEYRRLRSDAYFRASETWATAVIDMEPGLYALLGDREQALQALAQHLKQPSWTSANAWRSSMEFASLWDDPGFQAIVNNPANNAPLPIANRDQSLTAQ